MLKYIDEFFLSLIFCCFFGFYVLSVYQPYTFLNADPGWTLEVTKSLIEDGDLDLKNQLNNSLVKASDQTALGIYGEWYPVHEYLISVLAVPFFFLLGVNGALYFNILMMLAIALLLYRLLKIGHSSEISFISVMILILSSTFFGYSYSFSLDVFGVLTLLSSLYPLAKSRYKLAGFFWGVAVFSRLFNVLSVFGIIAYVFFKDKRGFLKNIILFILGGLPLLGIFFLSNYLMFGGIFELSYNHWNCTSLENYTSVLQQDLKIPYLIRLNEIIFSPQEGIFKTFPFFPFILLSSIFLLKKYPAEILLAIINTLVYLLFFAKYSFFPGGAGNRYLFPLLIYFAFPLALVVNQFLHKKPNK
ncbi:MAG: glycosyltransferase family 39 protein [Proteobacteria bacterium]|nr:glycosyltransferase family 39 protein [Pseudomonadota bacterium]